MIQIGIHQIGLVVDVTNVKRNAILAKRLKRIVHVLQDMQHLVILVRKQILVQFNSLVTLATNYKT